MSTCGLVNRLFAVSLFAVSVALFALPSALLANETEFHYNWVEADGVGAVTHPTLPEAVENDAGIYQSVEFRYDIVTSTFTFVANFRPEPAGTCDDEPYNDRLANLMTIIVSPGDMPFGIGEYAVFYIDYTSGTPIVSVYNYNGNDLDWDSLSYLGNDQICSSLDPTRCIGWINTLEVVDELDGSRTFRLVVDTTAINSFPIVDTSPSAQPWLGTQFQETIGYWVFSYAYPDMTISYDTEGYINDVDFGMNAFNNEPQYPAQCYRGFFDGKNKETERDSFCDGASGVYTAKVGELFQAPVSGVNPDGEEISLTYSDLPANSSIDLPSGSTAVGSIEATFSFTPAPEQATQNFPINIVLVDEDGLEVSCPFEVSVLQQEVDCLGQPGGSAEFDRCGVCDGDGNSCLGCNDVDVTETLFTLDGVADQQARLVKKLTRRLRRLSKGTSLQKENKQFRKVTNARADELFTDNWTFTWTIPSVFQQCVNTEFCVEVNNVSDIEQYNANSEELFQLVKATNRRMKKLGKKSKRTVNQAKALRNESLELITQVPATQSVCS